MHRIARGPIAGNIEEENKTVVKLNWAVSEVFTQKNGVSKSHANLPAGRVCTTVL
jgi:hypothetical protein